METLDPKTLPKTVKARVPRQANAMLGKAHSQLQTGYEQPLQSEKPEKLSQSNLDKLWLAMTETYGHRWTSNFGVSVDQNHAWAKHLSGVTGRQIANGLNALSGVVDGWPPSAPEFRAMCLQVPGLPSEAQAWDEARSGKYSHKAVKIAAEATSTFDLHSGRSNDKALKQRFERNYAIVMRRAQTGQPLGGRIAHGIGHDSSRPREQIQLEHSRKEAEALVIAQGIPSNGQSARALLLAKLNIRRDTHV